MPGYITALQMQSFAPSCDYIVIAPALDAAAGANGITIPARIACWLGQLHVESQGFTVLEERLKYSPERLTEVWRWRFPTVELAKPFAYNPEGLADLVYGGRMGNTQPGDGYRFRGRGLIQLTGRENYEAASKWCGVDLIANPQAAADPKLAALIAGAMWRLKGLNALADQGDIEGITRVVNGGLTGLADRQRQTARAKAIWREAPTHV